MSVVFFQCGIEPDDVGPLEARGWTRISAHRWYRSWFMEKAASVTTDAEKEEEAMETTHPFMNGPGPAGHLAELATLRLAFAILDWTRHRARRFQLPKAVGAPKRAASFVIS